MTDNVDTNVDIYKMLSVRNALLLRNDTEQYTQRPISRRSTPWQPIHRRAISRRLYPRRPTPRQPTPTRPIPRRSISRQPTSVQSFSRRPIPQAAYPRQSTSRRSIPRRPIPKPMIHAPSCFFEARSPRWMLVLRLHY